MISMQVTSGNPLIDTARLLNTSFSFPTGAGYTVGCLLSSTAPATNIALTEYLPRKIRENLIFEYNLFFRIRINFCLKIQYLGVLLAMYGINAYLLQPSVITVIYIYYCGVGPHSCEPRREREHEYAVSKRTTYTNALAQ